MMTKEGSTKIVNFMTPGAGVLLLGRGLISHIVKMHYFFKNLLLYSIVCELFLHLMKNYQVKTMKYCELK